MNEIVKQFKALSDPTRLRIVLLLLEHELCVCELESVLGMEQSRISHALRVLREAGLIDERREAKWVFYRTSKSLAHSLVAYLKVESKDTPEALEDKRRTSKFLESLDPSARRSI